MKLATITVLPLLASAAVVPLDLRQPSTKAATESPISIEYKNLEKRQFWNYVGKALQYTLPGFLRFVADNVTWVLRLQEQPVKKVKLRPNMNQKAQRAVFRFGPWTLLGSEEKTAWPSGYQMDLKSTLIYRTLRGLPSNAAILSAKPGLVFEDGTPADFTKGFYIHHFLMADMSKPTAPFAMCPNMHKEETMALWTRGYVLEAVGAGLIQVGQDAIGDPNLFVTSSPQISSAFLTGNDDLIALQAEIVNYNPTNKTIYFALELEYLENKPVDYLDASTMILSATGCASPGYWPPNNQKAYNYTSEPFEINQNGYIINTRGHLHDGGTAIELLLNDTVVCRSLPKYGRSSNAGPDVPETILEMSWCYDAVKIRTGDVLRVKTYYDVELHPLRKGSEMGGGGHGHGSNDAKPANAPAHNELEGMEEMGIMTTNFAWEIPSELKGTNASTASWFGSSSSTTTNTSKDKEASPSQEASWWSLLFGSPSAAERPKVIAAPSPSPSTSSGNWLAELFGSSASASPSPTAKTVASPAVASSASTATPSPARDWWSSLWGSSVNATTSQKASATQAGGVVGANTGTTKASSTPGSSISSWLSSLFGGNSNNNVASPSPSVAPKPS